MCLWLFHIQGKRLIRNMTTTTALKKPAVQGWHWADLLAELKKRGWSLRTIALAEGYGNGSFLGQTARRPSPRAEAILAAYAGVEHPKVIWPSRYDASGKPNRKMGPKPQAKLPPVQAITPIRGRNPQMGGGA